MATYLGIYSDQRGSDTDPLDPDHTQRDRILAALGRGRGDIPRVNEENLARYHAHLSEDLAFPFTAHYPEVTNSREEELHRCTVHQLLDPAIHRGDPFDGLICTVQRGSTQTRIPLVELEVAQEQANFQAVEDYWYWFWNWR